MVKLCAGPWHPFANGATEMIAITGALVVFNAVKDGIFPVPLPAKPMEGLLLLQVKLVPLTAPVKFIALVAAPLHTVWLAGTAILGVGLTVIVKLCEGPGQPLARGVTVIVAITGALVEFVAVNDGIFPLPLAAKPIEVLLFVQLNPVPLTAPEKFIALVVALLHKDWLAGCTTLGVGLTAIVKLCKAPGQP